MRNINSKKIIKFGQFNIESNDYSFKILESLNGSKFEISKGQHFLASFASKLIGEYNIYNSVWDQKSVV